MQDNSTISLTTSNVFTYFPSSTRERLKDWYAAMGNDLSSLTFTCPSDFLGDKWEIISRHINIPCILDFSSVSEGSGTFYPLKYSRVQELFIKLPPWNINFTSTSNRSDNTPVWAIGIAPLSIASIRYMITNAPTVSSKTFTIGANAIGYLNKLDANLISTLTNKGWTVA